MKTVENFLKRKIESKVFSGCSLIFGKPYEKIIELNLGTLGFQNKKIVNENTLFDLQSITKSICTGGLAIELGKKNLFDLKASVSKKLVECGYPNSLDESIASYDLLTHTSGLSDIDLEGEFESPEVLWETMLSAKPKFPPGTGVEYTDLGFRVEGKLIEATQGKNLKTLSRELLWNKKGMDLITFNPVDKTNIAETPDAKGVIDDEQVRFLGGMLGCDGAFSNAGGLFLFMSELIEKSQDTVSVLFNNKRYFDVEIKSFFDALAIGPKTIGWEINIPNFTYAGKFHTEVTFEKAGGAGTFIWFDNKSKYIFVFLTNYGKPKPFTEASWNKLVSDLSPNEISDLIYENL